MEEPLPDGGADGDSETTPLPREALEQLPHPWPETDLRWRIRQHVRAAGVVVVAVDDDPTGTQTVHDVPVLTTWARSDLEAELRRGGDLFYLLTNSRALAQPAAVALARRLGANLAQAARSVGRPLAVISRSDSTLRGHFPAETDALAETLELQPHGQLLAPYFREGGRYTFGDVHYVLEGEWLIPAALTEFARDATFGFGHSNLRRWVEEKTGGRRPAERSLSLPLALIRQGGPEQVAKVLLQASGGQPIVVNAACDRDLEVVVLGLLRAEARGKRFLCRTAASFVKVRAGVSDRGLLSPSEVLGPSPMPGGGLVIAGSHVPRSTRQLDRLLSLPGWQPVELDVTRLLDAEQARAHLANVQERLGGHLAQGRNVALYTSRDLIAGAGGETSLLIGQTVSAAVVQMAAGLERGPRFLIAKGGITSSDIATRALGVRRAIVLGQVAPGVPVWRLGPESRFPSLPYVIFPGNVGDDCTLAEIAASLAEVGA